MHVRTVEKKPLARRQPFRNGRNSGWKIITKQDQHKRGTRRTQGEHKTDTRQATPASQHKGSTRGQHKAGNNITQAQGADKGNTSSAWFSIVAAGRPSVVGGTEGRLAPSHGRALRRIRSVAQERTSPSSSSASPAGHEPVPHNFVTPRRPPPTLDIYVRPFPSQEIKIEHRTREAQGDHRKESCK